MAPNVYQFKSFAGSSHRILIDLVQRFAKERGLLIDLGAAGGELGAAVRGSFDRTIGFELDVDRIAALHNSFDQVVIADLERITGLPKNAHAIVMADVVEHLRDAKQILAIARESLAPDGRLFLSVPNIANITTRIGLLFGIFRYRDRGILDSTHLRFYTLKTISDEVEGAGFEIVATRASAIPIRLIIPGLLPESLLDLAERTLLILTQMWKALFAYQIILVARKKAEEAPSP